MEKALPILPYEPKGPPIVTVARVDSSDLEDPPTPDTPVYHSKNRTPKTRRPLFSFPRRISQIVGPEQTNKPNGSTVLWSVLGFIVLLAFGCVAVAYPLRPILITIGIVSFFVLSSLLALIVSDLRSRSITPPPCSSPRYSTDMISVDSSCLSKKSGQHHPDNMYRHTFLPAALCLPLVPQLEQDCLKIQSRYSRM